MLASLAMGPKARTQSLAACAETITYLQRRNATARKCHRKAAIKRLHHLGIRLTTLQRCQRE
jgi:hypothetical protein